MFTALFPLMEWALHHSVMHAGLCMVIPKVAAAPVMITYLFLSGLILLSTVSWNGGTPKSSIQMGFAIIHHHFWGYPHLWKPLFPHTGSYTKVWHTALGPAAHTVMTRPVDLAELQGAGDKVRPPNDSQVTWLTRVYGEYNKLIWWFPKLGVPPNHPFWK